ncbi:MAG: organomercurial lyase [Gemmatimonadota bacterium]
MSNSPGLEDYWHSLEAALPEFSPDEQRAAVTLYRELARGEAVSEEQLATALGLPTEEVREALARDSIRAFIYPDEQGRVLGFGGLAAAPMGHRFELAGRTLWTWCAWDSLFIPEILGEEATVESRDPETGATVRLRVAPNRVRSVDPETAVLSFVLPDAGALGSSAENVMASFCHFVYFFESRESGERWVANHEGTFLYEIDEALELARRLNARKFGIALEESATRA